MNRCNWCVGFIRRDCTIMERCVQSGVRRPRALAAAAREGGDVKQAPAESPQSGPKGNAQPSATGITES